jgi:putative ABC transport system permease protein
MNYFRHSWRSLLKNRVLALCIVSLLSTGLGATAVVFGAFDKIVLRPLPVPNAQELVRAVQDIPRIGKRSSFPYLFYESLHKQSSTLTGVFGEYRMSVAMTDPQPAAVVQVRLATEDYFQTLAVPALYGRVFEKEDDPAKDGSMPAVISFDFWRRRFGADASVIGRPIVLQGHRFLVIGVMPAAFNGVAVDTAPDIRLPIRAYDLLRSADDPPLDRANGFEVAARLRRGSSLATSQAETLQIWQNAEEELGKRTNESRDVVAQRLRDGMQLESLERGVSVLRDRFSSGLIVLVAGAVILLLLVSANVAGLLVAHGASRCDELAVRLAVGATRTQLVQQLLAESLALSLCGVAGGMAIAVVAAPLLSQALPAMRDVGMIPLPTALDLSPDWRVFLIMLGFSALTMLLCSLIPALSASRVDIDSIWRGAKVSRSWRARHILVLLQVALCTVLMGSAGLLVRTFNALHDTHPGFDREGLLTFTINPGIGGYTSQQAESFRQRLVEHVRSLPAVRSVATSAVAVMRGSGLKTSVGLASTTLTSSDFMNTSMNEVSVDYFSAMGIPILNGRGLERADRTPGQKARVVVNEAFRQQFFKHGNPVGQFFGIAAPGKVASPDYEIVGVSGDAKYRSLREAIPPTIYRLQLGGDFFQLLVHAQGRPEILIEPVRQAIADIDPVIPVSEVHEMSEEIDSSLSAERLTAALASIYGIIAVSLSAVGIYAVLAFMVTQQRKEIGIRFALGARVSDITRLIGTHALVMVAGGIAVGLAVLFVFRVWIAPLLYGVSAGDLGVLGTAVLCVVAPAALATLTPIVRAIRVHPASILRPEKRLNASGIG